MPKINPPFPHINVERCLWLPKLQTCLNIEWWGKGKGKLMFSNNSQICNFIIHFSLIKLTYVMNYCTLSIAFQGFISTVVGIGLPRDAKFEKWKSVLFRLKIRILELNSVFFQNGLTLLKSELQSRLGTLHDGAHLSNMSNLAQLKSYNAYFLVYSALI